MTIETTLQDIQCAAEIPEMIHLNIGMQGKLHTYILAAALDLTPPPPILEPSLNDELLAEVASLERQRQALNSEILELEETKANFLDSEPEILGVDLGIEHDNAPTPGEAAPLTDTVDLSDPDPR